MVGHVKDLTCGTLVKNPAVKMVNRNNQVYFNSWALEGRQDMYRAAAYLHWGVGISSNPSVGREQG